MMPVTHMREWGVAKNEVKLGVFGRDLVVEFMWLCDKLNMGKEREKESRKDDSQVSDLCV